MAAAVRRVADPYKRTSKKARKNRQLWTTTLNLRFAVPYTQKSYPRDFPREGHLKKQGKIGNSGQQP